LKLSIAEVKSIILEEFQLSQMSGDSDVAEPLIQPENGEDDENYAVERDDSTRPGRFVWTLTIAAALSGLLFGYDTGVMSATLVSLKSDLGHPLSVWEKSLITSITSLAALIASPFSGPLADTFGRKPIILVCDILFIAGALIQAFSGTVSSMTSGRAIIGLAIGAASSVTPLYIGEVSPASWRGRLVTISTLFITGGQVIAYVIGWAFANRISGWRWMVGIGSLPALVQIVALVIVPESPRWLIKAGHVQKAREVLHRIYENDSASVEHVHSSIVKELKDESSMFEDNDSFILRLRKTASELWTIRANKRALTIACLLQAAQQLCGFVSIISLESIIC
jgi:SP family myo-inositol transporter-like MFS transporter 13